VLAVVRLESRPVRYRSSSPLSRRARVFLVSPRRGSPSRFFYPRGTPGPGFRVRVGCRNERGLVSKLDYGRRRGAMFVYRASSDRFLGYVTCVAVL
uniref:Uncharacterized protein n=1 Tax=Aegilops tauschii subsp. strangulata TaxID=200361 RepID=A0A453GMS5_AEGTS